MKKYSRDKRAGDDCEILHAPQRVEKGARRAVAPAISNAELIGADAVGRLGIEVRIARQSILRAGLDPCLAGRVVVAQIGHADLAERATKLVITAFVALDALEIGQHGSKRPSLGALPLPIVEILLLAADKNQPVDRRRAAQDAAARPYDAAIAAARGRFRVEQS